MYSHDHNLHTALMIIDGMLELPDVGLAADRRLVTNVSCLQANIHATVLLCIR